MHHYRTDGQASRVVGFTVAAVIVLGAVIWGNVHDVVDGPERQPTHVPSPRPNSAPVPPTGQLDELAAPAAAALDTCAVPTGVAHRGGTPAFTENTLLAYTHVWAWGIEAWETDVRFDAAGVPVLMHDATIDRTTTGTGNVPSTTWSTSTVTTNDGQHLKDQTLAKLLELAAAKGAVVAIEPKVVPTAAQADAVLDLIDATVGRANVIIDSFETSHLAPFKALATDVTYSLVTSTAVTPATAAAVGPVLNIAASALTEQLVADYHAAGVQVYAWTLDTPGQWAPIRTWGIDRYVTNRAQEYRAWRDWVCTGEEWH